MAIYIAGCIVLILSLRVIKYVRSIQITLNQAAIYCNGISVVYCQSRFIVFHYTSPLQMKLEILENAAAGWECAAQASEYLPVVQVPSAARV